jgi:Rap1a immunity proteins
MTRFPRYSLALLTFGVCSHCAAYSGNSLKDDFESNERVSHNRAVGDDNVHASYGLGFVDGVASAIRGKLACVPEGTTVGQEFAVVGKFLTDHPELWHDNASYLVASALATTFPCHASR